MSQLRALFKMKTFHFVFKRGLKIVMVKKLSLKRIGVKRVNSVTCKQKSVTYKQKSETCKQESETYKQIWGRIFL